jgi:hypothetical protein
VICLLAGFGLWDATYGLGIASGNGPSRIGHVIYSLFSYREKHIQRLTEGVDSVQKITGFILFYLFLKDQVLLAYFGSYLCLGFSYYTSCVDGCDFSFVLDQRRSQYPSNVKTLSA